MPKYARFYSTTEAEAAASLSELCPQDTNAPHFSSDDAEQLAGLVDGTLATISRLRNDVDQPLFLPRPNTQSVEELLSNVSGFSIDRETLHRDKFVHHDSTSEEAAKKWKTRSQTPSSDEPSLRKVRVATPALSERATTSSDGSDDDMAHPLKRTHMDQLNSRRSLSDHYASYSDNVLQNMDTQFSKWSHDLNEGSTAVPFVMAQAPPDTHESLVKVDREFWIMDDESADGEAVNSQDAAKAVLERAQKKSLKRVHLSKSTRVPKLKTTIKGGVTSKDDSSKRVALIAKSRATKDSSLVVSKSANQRRSAMHKNKNRRSIMPSPPPTARKPKPLKKQEAQTEESQPTVFILGGKDDDQRRELDSALQNGTLDWTNDRHMKLLMQRLKSTGADNDEDRGRVVAEVEASWVSQHKSVTDILQETEQAGKTHRLKGKARQMAKSGAA